MLYNSILKTFMVGPSLMWPDSCAIPGVIAFTGQFCGYQLILENHEIFLPQTNCNIRHATQTITRFSKT